MLDKIASQHADVWAFACTVFVLFDGGALFESGCFATAEGALYDMVDTLGILPQRWWEKWEQIIFYFEKDETRRYDLLDEDCYETIPLAARIRRMRL